MPFEEAKKIGREGDALTDFYRRALARSKRFREEFEKRRTIIRPSEMPWERSPHGLLKHVINEELPTREFALEMYMQFIEPGTCSGQHRHMSEEVLYVLEGRGYDLHWDASPKIGEKYEWAWDRDAKRFEWEEGDFVYVPPLSVHQHFNADSVRPVRLLSATNRLVRLLGFDWLDQVEEAPK
jgi:quercetin dioxygenase-like cupin family protein